jgi:hypothetical protein
MWIRSPVMWWTFRGSLLGLAMSGSAATGYGAEELISGTRVTGAAAVEAGHGMPVIGNMVHGAIVGTVVDGNNYRKPA